MTKRKKDDGTRSGRMTGGGPGAGPTIPKQTIHKILYEDKVPLRDPEAPILAEGGKTPTGRDKTLPQFIDFETRSEVPLNKPISEQVIEAAMARWPGRTLEYVDLPDGAVGLRPYQRETLRDIMATVPLTTPVEGDTYGGFKNRYGRGGPSRRYAAHMSDYLRQSTVFATGDADPLHSAAGRRFFALGGGEGNRQLAYYAYGMALSQTADNWVDDVFNRKWRRAGAKLREYCMMDVLIFGDYAAIERRILFTLLDGYATVDITHRLTGPYGWASGQGTGILIQYMSGSDDHPWPTRQEADMISGIFVSYGCAPKYAQKAADCLFGSGQYSCIVTVSKLALRNLKCAMEVVGCAMTITQHPGEYVPDRDKDYR